MTFKVEGSEGELTSLPPSSDEDDEEVIARRRAVATNTLKDFYGLKGGIIDDLLGALAEAQGAHPPGLAAAAPAVSSAAFLAASTESKDREHREVPLQDFRAAMLSATAPALASAAPSAARRYRSG